MLGLTPSLTALRKANVTPTRSFYRPAGAKPPATDEPPDEQLIDEEVIEALKTACASDYELYRKAHAQFMARHPEGYAFSLVPGPNSRALGGGREEAILNDPLCEEFVAHGPYVTLPHGDYAVTFRYRIDPPFGPLIERFSSGRLDFDVCSDAGVTQHAAKTVEMGALGGEVGVDRSETLKFSLGGPVGNIEFRCLASSGVPVVVHRRCM